MKFSTYLEWSIRNIFQRAIGCRDKYVEIYARDGAFEKTMGYGKFVGAEKDPGGRRLHLHDQETVLLPV